MCHYTGGNGGRFGSLGSGYIASTSSRRRGIRAYSAGHRRIPFDRGSWVESLRIGNLVGVRNAYRSNNTTLTGFLTIFTKIFAEPFLFFG